MLTSLKHLFDYLLNYVLAYLMYMLAHCAYLQHSRQMYANSDKVFSPNLIDQSSCRMGLVLACMVRIVLDDWSIRLGENRPDRVLKQLAAMLFLTYLLVSRFEIGWFALLYRIANSKFNSIYEAYLLK